MKKYLAIFLALVMLLSFGACGSTASSSAPASAAGSTPASSAGDDGAAASPEMILRYAENQSDDFPTTQAAYRFSELVSDATDGRIKIEVYSSGVLGAETASIEQLGYGGLDFSRVSLGPLAEFDKSLNVLMMPYLYNDAAHEWTVLDSEIGANYLLSEGLSDNGIRGLAWVDAGARSFYTTSKVENLADLKGMKIRVQESELMMGMVAALGANATPMSAPEVYSSLQTGVIDGAENSFPIYDSNAHYEVAPYYITDEHTRVPEMMIISIATWDKLSAEDQAMIQDCANQAAAYEKELWAASEEKSLETAVAGGCIVTEVDAAGKAEFQQAIEDAGIYEKFCADYMDLVEEIKAMG